jgi:predicted nucleotidyltransferase
VRKVPNDKELILEGYRGSVSMGMYMENHIDDKDIFGIFVPPKDYVIGLNIWEVYEHKENEWDILHYSLKKFISLALKGNPNTLCLLWLNPEYYTKKTKWGDLLIANRDIFTAKSAYHSFTGYAYGQLRRMTHLAFEGYMGEKRKRLVQQFGYDTKNAAHLIRLLKMGIEFLTEGKLKVFREDNQQLLAIKKGEWTLEQVQKEADKLFPLAHEAYIHSKLPNEPDYKRANDLLIFITEDFWKRQEISPDKP